MDVLIHILTIGRGLPYRIKVEGSFTLLLAITHYCNFCTKINLKRYRKIEMGGYTEKISLLGLSKIYSCLVGYN
jgi:hypothetical protein